MAGPGRYLASDGLVPEEVVRDQPCVLVDVPCELPEYISCLAADLLRDAATAICADPSTAFPAGHPAPTAHSRTA